MVNDLQSIQKRSLEILLAVDKLCAYHNIKYFLDSGTLLGAIRHKGFIPWDDDVDITMHREDYERFLLVAEELPERYFVQTNQSDREFPFGFARVLDTRSRFGAEPLVKFKTGFCIDILPIDNAHNNLAVHEINLFLIKTISLLTKDKVNVTLSQYQGIPRKSVMAIGLTFGRFFSAKTLMSWHKKIAEANNHRKCKNKCVFSYSVQELKCLFPADIVGDTQMVEFEGHQMPAPIGWHEYLTIIYGDYMTLPPENERKPSHGFETMIFEE